MRLSRPTTSSTSPDAGGLTIKADHHAQLELLDLQAVDSALARLAHRRKTVPELAQLAELDAQYARVSSDLVAAQVAVSDLELEQSKAESDLTPVRERLARNQQRIADGTVADPKALTGLVDEVEHLKKRISDLEDNELEVMQQVEDATTTRDRLETGVGELAEKRARLLAKRDEQFAGIDGEVRDHQTERVQRVEALPAALLAAYDKSRAGHGGVGAAELMQRRCTGCQLEVNAADLRAFAAAPEDEVLRCEECGRILVRTQNSGI